jgi:heme-degrading monooxygenase HmoA
MPFLLIRHRVRDVARWQGVFAEQGVVRQANGSRGGQVLRSDADPNEIVVLLEWDDLERARLFADSDDLREAMNRGGVDDRPDIWFLEDVDRPRV